MSTVVERLMAATQMEGGFGELLDFVIEHANDAELGERERAELLAFAHQQRVAAERGLRALMCDLMATRIETEDPVIVDQILAFFEGPAGQLWMRMLDDTEPHLHEKGIEIVNTLLDRVNEKIELVESRVRGQS